MDSNILANARFGKIFRRNLPHRRTCYSDCHSQITYQKFNIIFDINLYRIVNLLQSCKPNPKLVHKFFKITLSIWFFFESLGFKCYVRTCTNRVKNTIPVPFKLWYVLDSCIVHAMSFRRVSALMPSYLKESKKFAILLSLFSAKHFQRFNSINPEAHQL